ncbi:hypothetical protein GCM10020366_04210 [Saccharopolyspora gregorii]|uniref:Novel STAND NTPase 1 domain-containing protein n=1 Tax=Saccharopolyspora gregorii TaxID=33914 RepID=A0ABP6RKD3_9PSEU
MTVAELRKAITGPAKATGLQIEPGLVDVLLRDLGSASAARTANRPSGPTTPVRCRCSRTR